MYGAIWRAFPGPWPVKLFLSLLLIAAVLYALVFWVFPWIDSLLEVEADITVGMAALGATGPTRS